MANAVPEDLSGLSDAELTELYNQSAETANAAREDVRRVLTALRERGIEPGTPAPVEAPAEAPAEPAEPTASPAVEE